MKASFTVLVSVILLAAGCSSVRTIWTDEAPDYGEINRRGARQAASLTYCDGNTAPASRLALDSETAVWFESHTGRIKSASLASICKVRFKGRARRGVRRGRALFFVRPKLFSVHTTYQFRGAPGSPVTEMHSTGRLSEVPR